jgi:hypothetical protein
MLVINFLISVMHPLRARKFVDIRKDKIFLNK